MNNWLKMVLSAAVFILAAAAAGQPVIFENALSPRIASYDIEVKLDAETGILHGKETLYWRNASSYPVNELQFHLYQNAFRNTKSSFMKETLGSKPETKMKPKQYGFIDIESISLATGEDLKAKMEFIHPDDDNAEDRTVLRVPLPRPLLPGQVITVKIEFTEKLPEPPFARSGAKKDFFFVSQWFPKTGVFVDGRWNCHQYHSHTEFFADYGVYNVKMTVPSKNLVGATGIEVSRMDNGDGTATHFYHAEDVHDFAWTTSPKFIEFKTRQNHVDIRLLLQAAHKNQAERHLEAARLAVKYFESWYGPYPYPNLTVVDPAPGAGGAGGMEYPTLITAGTLRVMPKGVRAVEMVIIHEFGHNYWYHLVGSNEFEESWLDEGINTYSEIQIVHDIYGAEGSMVDWLGLKADDLQIRRYSYLAAPNLDPVIRNGWQYYNGASYTAMSYSKPALMLITLENYLGKETMNKIMREWLARFSFQHPHTRDFITVANEVSGQKLDWFFDQALFSNAVLDYAVSSVSSKEIEKGKGYDFDYSTDKPLPKFLPLKTEESDKASPEKMYLSVVKVRRLGEFRFPVEIEMVFDDGEKLREKWDGQDIWKEFRYVKPKKLVSATVDPDKKIPLDLNWQNNTRTAEQPPLEKKKGGYLELLKFALNPQ